MVVINNFQRDICYIVWPIETNQMISVAFIGWWGRKVSLSLPHSLTFSLSLSGVHSGHYGKLIAKFYIMVGKKRKAKKTSNDTYP